MEEKDKKIEDLELEAFGRMTLNELNIWVREGQRVLNERKKKNDLIQKIESKFVNVVLSSSLSSPSSPSRE
jgi:hypothetical protein